MSVVRQIKDRQVDDTSPFVFALKIPGTGGTFDLSGATIWIDMIDSDGVAAIDHAEMTKNVDSGQVSYQPDATEVATSGTYTIQVYGVDGNGLRRASHKMRVTLLDNITTLNFVADLVASAGNDTTLTYDTATAMDGSATGGTPPYTYSWTVLSQSNAESVADIDDTASATTDVTLTGPNGTVTLQLAVTDALNTTATDTVVLTLSATIDDLSEDAVGAWFIDTYESTPRPRIANANAVSAASANLFAGSRNMFSGVGLWSGQGITLADNADTAPDGTNSASHVVGTGNWTLTQTSATLPAGTYTMAAHVKRGTGSDQDFCFYYANTAFRSPTKTATSGWQRFSYTFTIGSPSNTVFIGMGSKDGATSADLLVTDFEMFSGSSDLGPETYGGHLYLGKTGFDTTPSYASGALDMSSGGIGMAQFVPDTVYSEVSVQALVSKVSTGGSIYAVLSKKQDYTQFSALTEENGAPKEYVVSTLSMQSPGLWVAAGKGYHVLTMRYDGSVVQYWLDDILVQSSGTSGTVTLADLLFNTATTAEVYGRNSFAGLVGLWDRALSAADIRALVPLQQARAAESSITATTAARYLVAEGDSITWSTSPASYAYLFGPNASPALYGTNYAVSGSVVADLETRSSAVDATLPPILGGRKFILSVLIGRNDLNGASVPAFLADLAAYLDARRAAGWIVVLGTILPSTAGGFNTKRNTANTTLRTWVGVHCDALADFAADAIMGPDAAASDTTYYVDGTHPTSDGHVILETVYRTAINAI